MRHRAKRHASEDEAYKQLRLQLLGGSCEVCGPMLAASADLVASGEIAAPIRLRCTRVATEIHHRRKRSSAGALAHRDNATPSCHDGNMAVEHYPLVARAAGMVLREGDPDWERLSSRAWRKAQL